MLFARKHLFVTMKSFRIENVGSGHVWIARLEVDSPTHENVHAQIEKELDSAIVGFLEGDYSRRLDFKSKELIDLDENVICIMKLNKELCKNCNKAAEKGDLECLRYAHEHGIWIYSVCEIAAQYGHLDCLKYLHNMGYALTRHATANAASGGNLSCLKYLHQNNCPWDGWTCTHATWNGHIECLKYAFENGCPVHENICSWAARNGHLDCLKYLHENGCLLVEIPRNCHELCKQYCEDNVQK